MNEDLKEKSVAEIFALLFPGCGSKKQRNDQKMTKSKLKKDCNLALGILFLQLSLVSF